MCRCAEPLGLERPQSLRQLTLFGPDNARFEAVTKDNIPHVEECEAVIDRLCHVLGCPLDFIDKYNNREEKKVGTPVPILVAEEVRCRGFSRVTAFSKTLYD
jgi:hypothetical protein